MSDQSDDPSHHEQMLYHGATSHAIMLKHFNNSVVNFSLIVHFEKPRPTVQYILLN